MQQSSERRWVVEELYGLPDDGRHHELENGRLVSERLAGGRHGRIAAKLAEMIGRHARERRLGVVVTCDTGFVLHRCPDTVRGPDVAFVSRGRYEALEDETRAIPGPPDLAIEVLSPHDRPSAIHAKIADYLAAGAALVWIVDPDARRVAVYRSLFDPRIFETGDSLTAEEVLPGLRLSLTDLFEI